jgi:hypothetical protein
LISGRDLQLTDNGAGGQMSQHRPVPRLDLAPKLRRPLSLWNPLDYLRLLYWVFYFPQALRCYLNTFGNKSIPEGKMSLHKGLKWLSLNPIERQLILQGLALTVIIPLGVGVIFRARGFSVNWSVVLGGFFFGLVSGLVGGVTVGKKFGVEPGIASGVSSGVAFNVGLRVIQDLLGGVVADVAVGVASSTVGFVGKESAIYVANGVESAVVFGVASGIASGVASGWISGMVVLDTLSIAWSLLIGLGVLFGFALSLKFGGTFGVVAVLTFSGMFYVAFIVAILRLDNWLFGLLIALRLPHRYSHLAHVTLLPIPFLSCQLKNWLRQDWQTGLHNVRELLAFTLQFIPVIQAINQVLAEMPSEQVILRVAELTEYSYDGTLVRFASEKLTILTDNDFKPRLDTPARAVAAGFWYLQEPILGIRVGEKIAPNSYDKNLQKAIKAFSLVHSIPYREEMLALTQTLAVFNEAFDLAAIAFVQAPTPPQKPLLYPATWETIARLHGVVQDAQIVMRSLSRSARAFALDRALGELTDILNKANTLPRVGQRRIEYIALIWQQALLQVAGEVGKISITKPVTNPYIVGDPVEGNLFVGREDILRQLEELWVMGHRLQSIVLFGHRRMGKTSILLNARHCLGSGVKVAYINLLCLGDSPQGVGEVLMAISDAISEAVGCTPPTDADLLNLPYRTFERYLKHAEAHLSGGLIVALDEFEKIEELIEAEKIPKDFMGYLRGLVQMSSKVAFAFAGLHTLEEMTADYFQPFFASVIPIHVGFLQPGATRQILANPDEDFPLDYTPESLDQIYALTAGQPYLVQLVGFQLVRRYNDFVFEQGRPRDPVFTVEDVEAVINDPEFFKRGRYYFDGVWGQAARGASGQQAILRALAPHPEGLSLDELRTQLDALIGAQGFAPLQEETLQDALKTLMRHDVVQEREGHWQIIVELFRRWVLHS